MNAAIDPSRLYTVLTKTGLQTKDPVLYQLLYNLIGNLVKLRGDETTVVGGDSGGGDTIINQQIIQMIGSRSSQSTKKEYIMIGGQTGTIPDPTYDSVLTNGDPLIPEIIFDSFGDVIMITGLPL